MPGIKTWRRSPQEVFQEHLASPTTCRWKQAVDLLRSSWRSFQFPQDFIQHRSIISADAVPSLQLHNPSQGGIQGRAERIGLIGTIESQDLLAAQFLQF